MYRLINRNFSSSKRFTNEINRIKNKVLNADIIILEISSMKTVHHTEDDLYFNIDLYNRVIGRSENLKNNQMKLKKLYNHSPHKNRL